MTIWAWLVLIVNQPLNKAKSSNIIQRSYLPSSRKRAKRSKLTMKCPLLKKNRWHPKMRPQKSQRSQLWSQRKSTNMKVILSRFKWTRPLSSQWKMNPWRNQNKPRQSPPSLKSWPRAKYRSQRGIKLSKPTVAAVPTSCSPWSKRDPYRKSGLQIKSSAPNALKKLRPVFSWDQEKCTNGSGTGSPDTSPRPHCKL